MYRWFDKQLEVYGASVTQEEGSSQTFSSGDTAAYAGTVLGTCIHLQRFKAQPSTAVLGGKSSVVQVLLICVLCL